MPIVRIDIQSGKPTGYKRALLRGVREGIASALGVPHDRITQRIIETPVEDIDSPDIKTDRLTIVEITMLPRTPELKEAMYAEIARYLYRDPGVSDHDLVVLVRDPAAECFYLNGAMQCAMPSTGPAAGSEE